MTECDVLLKLGRPCLAWGSMDSTLLLGWIGLGCGHQGNAACLTETACIKLLGSPSDHQPICPAVHHLCTPLGRVAGFEHTSLFSTYTQACPQAQF